LRDFDGLLRKIDAVEIVGKDEIRGRLCQRVRGGFIVETQAVGEMKVMFFQLLVGLNEKSAAAAGRIANLHLSKRVQAS
jgi:hypothetical protein